MVIHAKICKTFQVIDRKPLVFIMYEIGSMSSIRSMYSMSLTTCIYLYYVILQRCLNYLDIV